MSRLNTESFFIRKDIWMFIGNFSVVISISENISSGVVSLQERMICGDADGFNLARALLKTNARDRWLSRLMK